MEERKFWILVYLSNPLGIDKHPLRYWIRDCSVSTLLPLRTNQHRVQIAMVREDLLDVVQYRNSSSIFNHNILLDRTLRSGNRRGVEPWSRRGSSWTELASDVPAPLQQCPPWQVAAHLPASRFRHHIHAVQRHLPRRWWYRPKR